MIKEIEENFLMDLPNTTNLAQNTSQPQQTPQPPEQSVHPSQPPSSPLAPVTPPHTPSGPTGNQPPQSPPVPPKEPRKGAPFFVTIVVLIIAFVGGLALAAWYFQQQFQKMSTSEITEEVVTQISPSPEISTLIIGTDATFQPMEYIDDEGGLIGYDIDLGYRIGTELESQVIYKNIPWEDLFTALDQGEINMIISGVTITPEREQEYDFSEPYLNAGQVLITRRDTSTITSAETVKAKRIAVQAGTTGEQEALKLTNKSLVVSYPNYIQATQALVSGEVDAVLSDLPAAKGVITANPSLKIASDPLTNEEYGIVFRKGDPSAQQVNEVLTSLRVKGILTDLKQKWLD